MTLADFIAGITPLFNAAIQTASDAGAAHALLDQANAAVGPANDLVTSKIADAQAKVTTLLAFYQPFASITASSALDTNAYNLVSSAWVDAMAALVQAKADLDAAVQQQTTVAQTAATADATHAGALQAVLDYETANNPT
jgi:hypothetical protein